VLITGVGGNTAANAAWKVTRVDADHFTLDNSAGNGTYTTGGTWTFGAILTDASNTSPITITSASHGLTTNQRVDVNNVQGNTAANGNWVITQKSTDTFNLNNSAGSGNFITNAWTVSGQITGASNPSSGPIEIASVKHGLKNGDRVRISDVLGNT